nr:uncharacterized protein LOC124813279 isoform X2 [Hydra vulgaris]XP_047136086.1 uncharacterized protein LOC124813279 isoform X2 [Hydra vulgaris]
MGKLSGFFSVLQADISDYTVRSWCFIAFRRWSLWTKLFPCINSFSYLHYGLCMTACNLNQTFNLTKCLTTCKNYNLCELDCLFCSYIKENDTGC